MGFTLKFQQSIPSNITPNYLATLLEMSEAAASANILPGLKILRIIDNEGKVSTDRANKFRDDEDFADFCKEILKELYPTELLDVFPTMPDDKAKIKNWFKRHSKVGDNAAGKFASMFAVFLEANPKSAPETKPTSGGAKPSGIAKETKPKDTPATSSSSNKPQTLPEVATPTVPLKIPNIRNPEIHVNVQIHISADATNDQVEKIFESMGKHLFTK